MELTVYSIETLSFAKVFIENSTERKVEVSIKTSNNFFDTNTKGYRVAETDPKIHPQYKTVRDLLQDFYCVPKYQREYVWGSEGALAEKENKSPEFSETDDPVFMLISDIHSAYGLQDIKNPEEYFLGTIIVCMNETEQDDKLYDLIDGQQRTTTLIILLTAIRDRLKEFASVDNPDVEDAIEVLSSQLRTKATGKSGKSVRRTRVDLQYEDSRGALDKLISDGPDSFEGETTSVQNLKNAYLKVAQYLRYNFTEAEELLPFNGYLQNSVSLVRIETPSVNKALEIFESINQRGVGLSPMDLLKNLIFMNAEGNEFEKLQKIWKEITQTLDDAKEGKPLRFLRYFILAAYGDGKTVVRDNDIYGWFRRNKSKTRVDTKPLRFAQLLLSYAKFYANLLKGQNSKGERTGYLWSIRTFAGTQLRQHYPLLLAGRSLDDKAFDLLAYGVDRMLTIQHIADVPSNTIERDYRELIPTIRKAKGISDIEQLLEEIDTDLLGSDVQKDWTRNLIFLQQRSPAYRDRYLLARVASYLEDQSSQSDWYDLVESYYKLHVEHILPQSYGETKKSDGRRAYNLFINGDEAEAATEEELDEVQEEYVPMFGNLGLLTTEANSAAGNKPWPEKKTIYAGTKSLFMNGMAEVPTISKAGKSVSVHTRLLSVYDVWDEEVMEKRQRQLAKIFSEIWEFTLSSKIPSWDEEES